MADTVTVPGAGPVPKKELTIGLVVVGVLVVVYYVRKKGTSSVAAPVATTTGAATDQFPADGTVGNPSDPYSTDPATGITYGNEAGTGTFSTFGTGTGNTPAPTGTVANGPPFSTNAQWSNWVIAQMLANNPQQDPAALTDALGLYLEGQPVDASQKTLIFDAIAVGGNPPVAGPNNYPPNVQTNGSTGGSNPPPPPAPAPSGPQQINVIGQTLEYGLPALESAGWTINNVSVGGHLYAQAGYPASMKTSVITGTQFLPGPGVAGVHFANSVDVTA